MYYFLFFIVSFILIGCNNIFNNTVSTSGIKNNVDIDRNIESNWNNIEYNNKYNDEKIGTKVIKEDFINSNVDGVNKDLKNINEKDIIYDIEENKDRDIVDDDIQKTKKLNESAINLVESIRSDISTDVLDAIYDDKQNVLQIDLKNEFKDMTGSIIDIYFILKSNEIKDIQVDNGFQKELSNGIIKIYKSDPNQNNIFNSQRLINIKLDLNRELRTLEIINIGYTIKKNDNIIKKQNKNIIIK